jgi:type IV pilus assembly protein PilO
VRLKLTNRERLLFTIAVICLVAAMLYYGAFKPQLEKVSKLEQQAREYSSVLKDIQVKANLENPIYIENKLLFSKTQELLKRYYPAILQENIILLLDEKLKKADIKVISMAFSEPALTDMKPVASVESPKINELEDLVRQLYNIKPSQDKDKVKESEEPNSEESVNVTKMTAALSLQGSYSQIYSFINEIELQNRSILVREITLTNNFNILTCDITLDFYSVPKPFEQVGDNIEWNINGVYGKENPF